MEERLKIRYARAGLSGTFPNGVVQCILQGTSWIENSAKAKDLGECSGLIEGLAATDQQPWREWLTHHGENRQLSDSDDDSSNDD